VMMEPSTIAGAVIGSFMSKYLPDFILTVSLAIVLSLLSFRTLQKGISMFHKESEEAAMKSQAFSDQEEADGLISSKERGGGDAPQCDSGSTPWGKIVLLIFCFAGCIALTVLKGSGHGSVIGVECGSPAFWALGLACIPWVTLFGAIFRQMLLSETDAQRQDGRAARKTEITWDASTTIRYPLICTLAGMFAGLFGVGGGIVKGPLMLEMGVNPVVAAATAATMILFTTSAACVSFEIFGLLEPNYGVACFVLGLVCTAIGQGAINAWMRTAKRQSPPVLSIGAVMAISTLLVAVEACQKFSRHDLAELFQPAQICSRSD